MCNLSSIKFIYSEKATKLWGDYCSSLLLFADISLFGCTNQGQGVSSRGFPNPSYNDLFVPSKRGNDLVLYNRHAVFEKENGGDQCIWFANDGYWHMGNCNNLGENSVYILKKRNMECPINYNGYESKFDGYWFSGNKNLGESVKTTQVLFASDGSNPEQNSPTASVTYQVRDGRYFQKCRWKKSPGGNWRCVPRHNQGMIWLRKLKYIKAFTYFLLFIIFSELQMVELVQFYILF